MAGNSVGIEAGGSWRASLPFWWRVARPFSLTASAIPVLVGGALAWVDGKFDWVNFFLLLVPCLLIQVATNGFNEYYDHRRGLDTHESVGIAGVIVGGHLSDRDVLRFAVGCLVVALPFCLLLVARTGPAVLAIGVASAFAAWVYSGGPRPVAYTPFGEVQVFIFMGLIQVALAYLVHAGEVSAGAVWAALPVSALVAAILLANNLRDQASDAERGRRTLPIVLGRPVGLGVLAGLCYGSFLLLMVAVLFDGLPPLALLPVVAIPAVRGVVQPFTATTDPRALDVAVKRTAQLHMRFGLLLTAGILIAPLIHGWLAR